MIWDLPRKTHDDWIVKTFFGIDISKSVFRIEPTRNPQLALNLLEEFLKADEEYSWVECGYDQSDYGWQVIIHSAQDTFRPMGHGDGWGLAWAICTALYNLMEEREQRCQNEN